MSDKLVMLTFSKLEKPVQDVLIPYLLDFKQMASQFFKELLSQRYHCAVFCQPSSLCFGRQIRVPCRVQSSSLHALQGDEDPAEATSRLCSSTSSQGHFSTCSCRRSSRALSGHTLWQPIQTQPSWTMRLFRSLQPHSLPNADLHQLTIQLVHNSCVARCSLAPNCQRQSEIGVSSQT